MIEPFSWNFTTALFGGRFDPPHLGHREVVRGLFQYPGIQKVCIIPSGHPPHKQIHAPGYARLLMAQLNFQTHTDTHPDPSLSSLPTLPSQISIDDRELKRIQTPHYTWDTLFEYYQENQNIAFVIGSDQLPYLHSWYRFPDFFHLAHWIVLQRQSYSPEATFSHLNLWEKQGLLQPTSHATTWSLTPPSITEVSPSSHYLMLCETKALSISSTVIRDQLSHPDHLPLDFLLPSVSLYLKKNEFYSKVRASLC